MKLLIALVIIAIISLVGARISFFNRRLPMGVRSILLTGTEYIFVGALLGHLGAGLLDKSTLTQLEPFLLFCLCWVGFLFGLQFEIKQIKKLPLYYFTITAVQAFVAFVIVAPPVYFLLSAFVTLPESLLLMMAVTLGSTASSTAQTTLAIISRNYKIRNKQLMDLLRYMAGVDGMFALGFFTLAICFFFMGRPFTSQYFAFVKMACYSFNGWPDSRVSLNFFESLSVFTTRVPYVSHWC